MRKLLAGLVLVAGLCGGCYETAPSVYVVQPDLFDYQHAGRRVTVLPLQNLTPAAQDLGFLDDLLYNRVTRGGVFATAPEGDARQLLDIFRIRWFNKVNPEDVKVIGYATRSDFVIAGALTEFKAADPMLIGISLKLIETREGQIVISVVHTATEKDRESIFGQGRVESIVRLGENAVDRALAVMEEKYMEYAGRSAAGL